MSANTNYLSKILNKQKFLTSRGKSSSTKSIDKDNLSIILRERITQVKPENSNTLEGVFLSVWPVVTTRET